MGCDNSNTDNITEVPPHQLGRTKVGTHLNSPEDLVSWPEFPRDCQSLLSKHLTKQMWDKYHDKKDAAGVSFK